MIAGKLVKSSQQIAQHFRSVFFGGNWTAVNLRDQMIDVSWEDATKKIQSFHTIAELVFHIKYFVAAVLPVLRGHALDAHDKFSFDCPPIDSQESWDALLNELWQEAEAVACEIEKLADDRLFETFCDEKYGTYHRSLFGVIEHTHYHLGQIVIMKKLLASRE